MLGLRVRLLDPRCQIVLLAILLFRLELIRIDLVFAEILVLDLIGFSFRSCAVMSSIAFFTRVHPSNLTR